MNTSDTYPKYLHNIIDHGYSVIPVTEVDALGYSHYCPIVGALHPLPVNTLAIRRSPFNDAGFFTWNNRYNKLVIDIESGAFHCTIRRFKPVAVIPKKIPLTRYQYIIFKIRRFLYMPLIPCYR